jgi:LCP family protein required for cell wall assembly
LVQAFTKLYGLLYLRIMNARIPEGENRPKQFNRQLDGPVRRSVAAPSRPVARATTPPRRVRHGRIQRQSHWLRWSSLAVLSLVLVVGLFLGFKVVMAASKVITRAGRGAPALDGSVSPTTLKGEGDGRINILILGIGGQGHDGATLSDTIMVASIDPKTKDVAMLSIPRDLYVKIPGYGYGKINAANAYGGPALAEQVVSKILDLPIHYYVQVDFSGFRQAVDAVGGVDITVAQAIYDKAYPCDVGYGICPYYQAAGQVHMTGSLALKYSRCRHDQPTGDCGDDTGRAARQQQVIAALRQRALSAGTLTNPLKIASLVDAVGSHVTTDLQLGDIKQLALIIKDVDPSKVVNRVPQFSGPDAILTSTSNEAGSVLVPLAGEFNYSELQNLAHSIFIDHYITSENALVQIQNGSGATGLGSTAMTSLKSSHYNVMPAATAVLTYSKTIIYDYTGGKKPYTINYLEQRFGVRAQSGTPGQVIAAAPPITPATATTATQTPQIVVILGTDYAGAQSATAVSSTP